MYDAARFPQAHLKLRLSLVDPALSLLLQSALVVLQVGILAGLALLRLASVHETHETEAAEQGCSEMYHWVPA